jgi:hypothetical protein
VVDPEGSGGQALAKPAVSRGTAEAGGSGTVRESGTRSTSEASVRPRFQRRANRRSARLKARTRRGQAALPIAAGAWEARRATGYG